MMISRRLARVHNLGVVGVEQRFSSAGAKGGLFGTSESMSFRESERWRFFQHILGLGGVSARPASHSGHSSTSSPRTSRSHSEDDSSGYFFGTGDKTNNFRRESTIDDEAKVVGLLKEILAYQDTNMSNWIIEVRTTLNCLLCNVSPPFIKNLFCRAK